LRLTIQIKIRTSEFFGGAFFKDCSAVEVKESSVAEIIGFNK
jgi:hypothetical protein